MSSWWDAVRNWFRGNRKGDFPEPNRENPDSVQHFTGREDWIRRRKNLATGLGSREISEKMDAKIRAQSFFSARVEEGHILDKLREVSDAFTLGEIGQAEARTQLKRFLVSLGYDPQQGGLSNLASTGRLNLILEQNARMAYAVGRWQEGMDPDIKERFPCWRYVGTTSMTPRDSHARYVGHVYSKDDPIWHTIFPPSDFNCKCSVEDCDAPAEPAPKEVRPAESGFSFDPAHAFEEFDLGCVKDDSARTKVHDDLLALCQKGNCSASFYGAKPQKLLPESYREPENIEEIRETFQKVEKRREIPLDEFSISLGKILPEHIKRLGLKDFREDIIFKHEKANFRVGPNHWEQHHSDTLNEHDAIELFRHTIWNPNAELREDIVGKRRRICFYVKDKDSGELTNVWVTKDNDGKLILEVVDSWKPERQYIDHLGSHHKKKHPDRS